jgi:3-oxoacyl-[acyl-carrier-protein] synthase II
MSGRQVVITGRAIVSPLGVGFEQHWSAVMRGERVTGLLPRLATLGLESSVGAEVRPEMLAEHLARLPRKQQKLYNRITLLAMIAAALAMEDARLAPGDLDPTRLGVYLGVNVVGWELRLLLGYLNAVESETHRGELDVGRANAYCMRAINPLEYSLKTLPNLTAGYLAIAHNAQGICRAYTDGAVGGLLAIGDAYHAIRDGDLDVALCGGADAQTEELVYASAVGMGLVAGDREPGTGIIPAEGSAVLVLEAEDRARARGAVPRARILAISSMLGTGRLVTEVRADGLAARIGRAMQSGFTAAGIPRAELLVLHHDGIAVVDEAERLAVEALPAPRRPLATIALKRLHGHLGAASPAAEALTCSALLDRGMISPMILGSSIREGSAVPRTALVNAVGLFGEVACLALGAMERSGAD